MTDEGLSSELTHYELLCTWVAAFGNAAEILQCSHRAISVFNFLDPDFNNSILKKQKQKQFKFIDICVACVFFFLFPCPVHHLMTPLDLF